MKIYKTLKDQNKINNTHKIKTLTANNKIITNSMIRIQIKMININNIIILNKTISNNGETID